MEDKIEADPKLYEFAKTLLESDDAEFERFLTDRHEMPFKEFAKKYAAWIRAVYHGVPEDDDQDMSLDGYDIADAHSDFSGEELQADPHRVLVDFAVWKSRLAWVDWSGEEEEGEIVRKIDEMLFRHHSRHFVWDQKAFNEKIDLDRLDRGDYVLLLFKAIDEVLKKSGLRLVFFDTGDDGYRYAVLSKDDFEKVDGLSWIYHRVCNIDTLCAPRLAPGCLAAMFPFLKGKPDHFGQIYNSFSPTP